MFDERWHDHPRRQIRCVIFEALFALLVVGASYHHVKLKLLLTEDIGEHGLNLFRQVSEHEAAKPWQYRLLLPELAGVVARLDIPFFSDIELLWKLSELCSLVLLVFAFRRYIQLFIKSRIVSALGSFLILVILPFNIFFPRPYYAYYWFDTPAMLFFTLGLIFLYKRWWLAYYATLILGTLNRETSCFLIAVYFLTSVGKDPPIRIFGQCAGQLLVWLSIKITLYAIFFDNPGPIQGFEIYNQPSQTHLTDNIAFLLNPKNAIFLLSHMGFLWLFALAGVNLVRDDFVRRSTLVAVPYFLGMMIVANIYELRIFCELIPVFLMALILMVKTATTDKVRQIPV